MIFPEMLQDAALSRGDHHILLAAKYMQDVKYRSDSRNRVVCHLYMVSLAGYHTLGAHVLAAVWMLTYGCLRLHFLLLAGI